MPKVFLVISALVLNQSVFAETKPEVPGKSETNVKLYHYAVTGISGANYTISTTPNPDCGISEESPCDITSTTPITNGLVPRIQVDNQTNGFIIESRTRQL